MKKLAECLLRRKELQMKIDRIGAIKEKDIYEIRSKRQSVNDSLDDVIAQVPRVSLAAVTKEYDHYCKQLRLVDAAIQQMNWTSDVDGVDDCFNDFE